MALCSGQAMKLLLVNGTEWYNYASTAVTRVQHAERPPILRSLIYCSFVRFCSILPPFFASFSACSLIGAACTSARLSVFLPLSLSAWFLIGAAWSCILVQVLLACSAEWGRVCLVATVIASFSDMPQFCCLHALVQGCAACGHGACTGGH